MRIVDEYFWSVNMKNVVIYLLMTAFHWLQKLLGDLRSNSSIDIQSLIPSIFIKKVGQARDKKYIS